MAHWTAKRYRDYIAKKLGRPVAKPKVTKWSEPEKRYFLGVLHGAGEYESCRLRVFPDSVEEHHYTPDFTTVNHGRIVHHEVKGAYRLQSQDAARLRFIGASWCNSMDTFIWAKERRNRRWDVEVFRGGIRLIKQAGVTGFEINREGQFTWHGK